jgi:hypothetical protein
MSRETTNAGKLGRLQNLTAALAANSADLPQFQGSIAQLADLLTQAQEVAARQKALAAQKQEASKQLAAVLASSGRLSTVMQLAVKQHYGPTSEKLVEFDLQPFRGRKPKPAPETPAPTPPVHPASATETK